jgi:hypothetical protein
MVRAATSTFCGNHVERLSTVADAVVDVDEPEPGRKSGAC